MTRRVTIMRDGVLTCGTATGASRRMLWDGKELKRRTMAGQPFNGGLFVTLDGGRTTFVANATYGRLWWFQRSGPAHG